VIRRARSHKAAIHPLGAGGRPARIADQRTRVHIATRRLDQVVQLDETSLLVHARPGSPASISSASWRRATCRSATTRR